MRMIVKSDQGHLLRMIRTIVQQGAEEWNRHDPLLQKRQNPMMVVENLSTESWASATFSGCRHRLDLRLSGKIQQVAQAKDRLHDTLAQSDIPLARGCVIDSSLNDVAWEENDDGTVSCRLTCHFMTLDD